VNNSDHGSQKMNITLSKNIVLFFIVEEDVLILGRKSFILGVRLVILAYAHCAVAMTTSHRFTREVPGSS
jgi:hypothetical protein